MCLISSHERWPYSQVLWISVRYELHAAGPQMKQLTLLQSVPQTYTPKKNILKQQKKAHAYDCGTLRQ